MKRAAPAAHRNERFIVETFGPRLPDSGCILEIASGSGHHAAAFARAFPHLDWQPSDPDPAARASIEAYRDELESTNLRPALDLDVTEPWPVGQVDAIINVNMIHISPWITTTALFEGASDRLPSRGPLMLYGPFMIDGQHTAPSNAEFDARLKAKSPAYGVRDLTTVTNVARSNGFDDPEVISMPANNFSLIFRRR